MKNMNLQTQEEQNIPSKSILKNSRRTSKTNKDLKIIQRVNGGGEFMWKSEWRQI